MAIYFITINYQLNQHRSYSMCSYVLDRFVIVKIFLHGKFRNVGCLVSLQNNYFITTSVAMQPINDIKVDCSGNTAKATIFLMLHLPNLQTSSTTKHFIIYVPCHSMNESDNQL